MSLEKITDFEFNSRSVSSLPVRPNGNSVYGKTGMSANQLKASFDALPALLRKKINQVIDSVTCDAEDENAISKYIRTGTDSFPTLSDIFKDIKNGEFLLHLPFGNGTAAEFLAKEKQKADNSICNIIVNESTFELEAHTTSGMVIKASLYQMIYNAVVKALATVLSDNLKTSEIHDSVNEEEET